MAWFPATEALWHFEALPLEYGSEPILLGPPLKEEKRGEQLPADTEKGLDDGDEFAVVFPSDLGFLIQVQAFTALRAQDLAIFR